MGADRDGSRVHILAPLQLPLVGPFTTNPVPTVRFMLHESTCGELFGVCICIRC
jgi:hypothetical protein